MKLSEVSQDVEEIQKDDKASSALTVCKIYEEVGELIQELNKLLGRKNSNESENEIKVNILEELADVLQCLLAYGVLYDYDDFYLVKDEESNTWDPKNIGNANLSALNLEGLALVLYQSVARLDNLISGNPIVNQTISQSMNAVFYIGNYFGFSGLQIKLKVLEKNSKWKSVIDERRKKNV